MTNLNAKRKPESKEKREGGYQVDDNVDKILDYLFGSGINSDARLGAILDCLRRKGSLIFWPVFLDTWSSCDDTRREECRLLGYLRRHHKFVHFREVLDELAQDFFDKIPDLATIYRGCSRDRKHGLSWTTDAKVAARYARGHRRIPVPDAAVFEAQVRKSSILAVICEREESEILVEPRQLLNLVESNVPPAPLSNAS